MGRIVHPSLHGEQPVSASATTAPGEAHTYEGKLPYVEARPLRLDEIPGVVADYVTAARNAIAAGFDGVEIHGANGYLLDQFPARRQQFPHRCLWRFHREPCPTAAGSGARGRRRDRRGPDRPCGLSPNGEVQGVIDSNPEPLFAYVADELDKIGIAFLHLREARTTGSFRPSEQAPLSPVIRQHFKGVLILNGDYTPEDAEATVAAGKADAIAFGRPFISNPDLVERIRIGASLAQGDPATFYAGGDEGYIDYPAYTTAEAA